MYIGGAQKRPDGNYSYSILDSNGEILGQIGDGSRKDIRDAVEAAHSAAKGWGKRAAHNRAQILYYIAENLSIREEEFSGRLAAMSLSNESESTKLEQGATEVKAAIERLFHWAAFADKYGGTVQETTLYGMTAAVNEPIGVIGITTPEEYPLLGLISLVAPAVVRGNAVVVVPSKQGALAATDLYQVLDTSDLPGGVLNIVTGEPDVLSKCLAEHQDLDAMWYFRRGEAGALGSYHVERLAADNMKRTYVSYGQEIDWSALNQSHTETLLRESTSVKNIWVPMGGMTL